MKASQLPRRIVMTLVATGLALVAMVGVGFSAPAAAATVAPQYLALSQSVSPVGAAIVIGNHDGNARLTIELYVNPNAAAEQALYASLYTPGSPRYHHFLSQGQYAARFAPTAGQIAQVTRFLSGAGLAVTSSVSPFLVRATGTTARIQAAFHTAIKDYRATVGTRFYQNATALMVPASLNGLILGVSGTQSGMKVKNHAIPSYQAAKAAKLATPTYGAGPGGSGLTPSQIVSVYSGTDTAKENGAGQGVVLGLYEMSGYNRADITAYAQYFYGKGYTPHIVDVPVDGGPTGTTLPLCVNNAPPPPATDCVAAKPDYSGDIEVNADIEMQLAVAPKNAAILVYNAPNDYTGQAALDEYYQIASDDAASTISSSWDSCEADAGYGYALASYGAFQQMAMQAQSMFVAGGDTGAFGCLRGSGNPALNTGTWSSQPYVTSVGGTSFSSFDPGKNPHPSYPATGFETVWNVLNRCSATDLASCANLGAGGGGVSIFWSKPSYQYGHGVISAYSAKAATQCDPTSVKVPANLYCREVPDVSANADEYTPYSEFCVGVAHTNSTCQFYTTLGFEHPTGWLGIGGTSLATPIWSAIIADWQSYHHGQRFGFANEELYELFRASNGYTQHFHDITGRNQTENNNGYYPVTVGYDMATGIGTPQIAHLVESNP